ncbi:hypothetical protein [Aerococcus urinaeequi]|uniref:hypothetical protein n=1 Tax=Aerococcus urinaeequi TaxID=51665 RepID=UPI000845E99E|nr:hypothetical protein [Aerococcus urinaeequi]
MINIGRPTKFDLLERNIDSIENDLSKKHTYSITEINNYLAEAIPHYGLAKSTSLNDFLSYLSDQKLLEAVEIEFRNKKILKYTHPSVNDAETFSYEEMLKFIGPFNKHGYFSHYTAAFLNNLTENIVKTFYYSQRTSTLNRSKNDLSQEDIDNAFSKPVKTTSNTAQYNSYKIVLLENSFRQIGVIKKESYSYTNIEKTLLDITIRPEYSGGAFEVLNIFKNAKDKVSVNRLRAYLKKANYLYPYHQAIGLYMEKAGYNERDLNIMRTFPFDYDFYLIHNMNNKKFSNKWRVYYPSELDDF